MIEAATLTSFIHWMVFVVLHFTLALYSTIDMLLYLLSLLSLLALSVGAQQVALTNPTSSPTTPAFDKLVTQNLDRLHTPGLVSDCRHTWPMTHSAKCGTFYRDRLAARQSEVNGRGSHSKRFRGNAQSLAEPARCFVFSNQRCSQS